MSVKHFSALRRPKLRLMSLPALCLLVTLGFSFIRVPVAHAVEFNPGCTGTVGDAAQLQAAVITSNGNSAADSINLVKGCTYTLTASLAVTSDGGNPLSINGNGAVIDGDNQFIVFNVAASTSLSLYRLKIKGGNSNIGGGGILNAGTLTLTTVSIVGNTSTSGGGGLYNSGTVIMNDSTISGNKTTVGAGGGIFTAGNFFMTNSTIFGNQALNSSGGGIHNGAAISLTNSTLSANKAANTGGIFNNGGTVNLGNTIIANSTNGDCNNAGGTIIPSGGNLIEDGSCSVAGALSGDPKLGKQAGTPAHLPLMPGSKAIDKGGNGVCADTDQRGKPRPQDGNGDGTKICDLGSYEKSAATGAELLTNGGFESSLAPWGVNNGSGDGVVCQKAQAYTGNCSFVFNASASENAQLVQTINVSNRSFKNGDVVRLSMMVKATNAAVAGNIEIHVLYPNSTQPGKTKTPLRKTNGYEEFTREISHLDPGLLTISLRVNNKSKAGKVYIDAVSLRHVKSNQLLTLPAQ